MWLYGLSLLTLLALGKCTESELSIEAAFQGRCGHGSPCDQLCYELHDGMYECDCTEGFELHKNGYSCQEINSTFGPEDGVEVEEDVLYQKGASFSAQLDSSQGHSDNRIRNTNNNNNNKLTKSGSYDSNDSSELNTNKLKDSSKGRGGNSNSHSQSNDNELSVSLSNTSESDDSDESGDVLNNSPRSATPAKMPSPATAGVFNGYNESSVNSYYTKDDVDLSVYDDVDNNKLNLRSNNDAKAYQNIYYNNNEEVSSSRHRKNHNSYNNNLNNSNSDSINSYIQIEEYQSDMEQPSNVTPLETTTVAAITTAKSLHGAGNGNETMATISHVPCLLDCGLEGVCDNTNGAARCLCPFGKAGNKCEDDIKIDTPRFTKSSWMAFAALRGAYKHVQLHIEFRPESYDGIILLTGERDDLTGDFMAVLIYQGFIEFWFDCGSGTGKVRSEETVVLNQWNSVTVYRHRWDAWLVLNQGARIQGRSKGLFSRITFREPVFLGGTGNITGLTNKLPISDGMVGCIQRFIANEHEYTFSTTPHGDITQGFDVQECTTDRCGKFPCRHGGKCLPSDQGAICLCPLGFGGDLCEMRLDLQVPSFNGSSYLRFAPLGDAALIWFELKMIIKPQHDNGLLLYSGHKDSYDFIALSLIDGFVEFAFDLGSGPAIVRSEHPLIIGQWHTVRVSRTARLAVLKINQLPEVMTISANGFWHLSLPHSLFLGGVQTIQSLPAQLKNTGLFVGCVQKIEINGKPLSIISEALGGTNVDNCPHACIARPCGPLSQCIPSMESYECHCNPLNAECNKAEELLVLQKIATIPPTTTMAASTIMPATLITSQVNLDDDEYDNREVEGEKNDDGEEEEVEEVYDTDSSDEDDAENVQNSLTTDADVGVNISPEPATATNANTKNHEMPYEDDTSQSVLQNELKGGNNGDAANNENVDDDDDSDGDYYYNYNDSDDETVAAAYPDDDAIKDATRTTTTTTTTTTSTKATTTARYVATAALKSRKQPHFGPVTHVNGKYVSVDERQLLINDQLERKKQQQSKKVGKPPKLATQKQQQHNIDAQTPMMMPKIAETNFYSDDDLLTTKELIDDMAKILKNGNDYRAKSRKYRMGHGHGACFTGTDSYFHYNDAETMKQIISYKIDLNLRFKTHSSNGLILWSGRHSAMEDDDFLSLGIENGHLHLRYNLGSGEVNIKYNGTKVSDGLWHRIRAIRNLQEGSLVVDDNKPLVQRSPGRLRQLNTDTGLYVGGMPDVSYFTRRRYFSGIVGCISEIVLSGELRLSLDPETLGTAHNVEPGIL